MIQGKLIPRHTVLCVTVHMNAGTFPSSFRSEDFQPELIQARPKSHRLQQPPRRLVYNKCKLHRYTRIYIHSEKETPKSSSTSSSYIVLYIVGTTCSRNIGATYVDVCVSRDVFALLERHQSRFFIYSFVCGVSPMIPVRPSV